MLGYGHFLSCAQCLRFPRERKQKWLKIYGNQTGGCMGEGGQIGKTSKKKSQLITSHKPLIYWNTTYSLTSNYCKSYTVYSQQDGAEHCLHSRCLAIPEKEDFAYFRMSSISNKKRKRKKGEKNSSPTKNLQDGFQIVLWWIISVFTMTTVCLWTAQTWILFNPFYLRCQQNSCQFLHILYFYVTFKHI